MGNLSAHFTRSEAACHHCGRFPEMPWQGELLDGLEALRSLAYPTGLVVLSWYRCAEYNATLPHAAADSMHVRCAAVDPAMSTTATVAAVRGLRRFSGIGWQMVDGRKLVRHVDVRHLTGHNLTGGTVRYPTLWEYLPDGSRR